MSPARGRCLVRRVETAESFAGSKIVLPDVVREKIAAQQVEILAVGAAAYCDDDECNRLHQVQWKRKPITGDRPSRVHVFTGRAGAWALLAPRSLVECGDDDTYLVQQDDVLAVLTP